MTEIYILDEKAAKRLRLKRAECLADLFKTDNARLLDALESWLGKIEYECLLMIYNNDDGRDRARGKSDLAATLISEIKGEIQWALDESKKPESKKEKS